MINPTDDQTQATGSTGILTHQHRVPILDISIIILSSIHHQVESVQTGGGPLHIARHTVIFFITIKVVVMVYESRFTFLRKPIGDDDEYERLEAHIKPNA